MTKEKIKKKIVKLRKKSVDFLKYSFEEMQTYREKAEELENLLKEPTFIDKHKPKDFR